jgi:Acetyltransferases
MKSKDKLFAHHKNHRHRIIYTFAHTKVNFTVRLSTVMENDLLIEKIQPNEFDQVTTILTDAFISNPAYSIIFKNKDQLKEGLLWLFKSNLFILNRHETLTSVIKEKHSGKIIGTFTIIPPQGIKKELSDYLKVGIPGFIMRFGIDPLFRMLKLDEYCKELLTKSIESNKYYYLHMVVVQKEWRGKGIGSYAIKSALEKLASTNPSCKLLGLTTQLPENVIFYSKLGFDKLDEGYVYFKKDKYYNYNMKIRL